MMANTILTPQVDAREGADVDPLKEFCSHISKSFYKPDLQAARIILGTAFAHYFPRVDPIWLFVVGPPSSGKTAITIEALSGLTGMFGPGQAWGPKSVSKVGEEDKVLSGQGWREDEAVEILSTINSNSFLSHMQGQKSPGLLEQIAREFKEIKDKKTGKPTGKKAWVTKCHYEKQGTHKHIWGNLLCLIPDFTVMASMRREMRGEIMGQLRRIYDGNFEKKVGTEITKCWKGKMTMIAATTPIIDKYTSIDASLGERFIQVNWRASRDRWRGRFTIDRMMRRARGEKFKTPLKDMTRELFADATAELLQIPLGHHCVDRLASLALIIADSRLSVYGQMSETSYVINETTVAEDIHRLLGEYFAQLSGITRLHKRTEPNEQDVQDVLRCGIETLPTYRSVILQAGIEHKRIRDYKGRDEAKRIEAAKLTAIGVVKNCEKGNEPVELTDYWQEVVDACKFDNASVFDPEGAVAAKDKARGAAQQDIEIDKELKRIF